MHRFDWKAALLVVAGVCALAPAASAEPLAGGYGYGRGYRGGYGYRQRVVYAPAYYAVPPEGGFWDRRGLTIGFSGGLGGMMSEDTTATDCFDCDYNPLALSGSFHIGGMINPRLALMFDLWVTGQTVSFDGTEFVTQTMALFAAKYWVTPRLWLKGGIGAAHLSFTLDDGFVTASDPVDDGAAILGSLGYEVVSLPHYALDLDLRLGAAVYEGIGDQVNSVTVNLGLNWF